MKKRYSIFLLAMAMILSANFSWAEEDDPIFSFDTSVSGYSKYVGGISGATFFDEAVVQPSIMLTHNPSGLYLNLWASYSPDGGIDSDYGDEVDYIAGINQDVGPVNVDIYYAHYNCYELDKHGDGDVHAVGTVIGFPEIFGIEPYVEAEYNIVRGVSQENGLLYRLGGNFSPIEKLTLDISAGGHSEIYGTRHEGLSFARGSITYEINLAENLILTPEINLQKRIGYSEQNGGFTDDVIWGGVTASYSF